MNRRASSQAEFLVTIGCVAFLAVALLPFLARSRHRSSRVGCSNCLKQIGLAFRTWSIDNNDRFPMQVSVRNGGTMELAAGGAVYPHFLVMSNELSTPRILVCPSDTGRRWATNLVSGLGDSNLSYFVNLDSINRDGSSLLAGDRNVTNKAGAGTRLVQLTPPATIAWTREIHGRQGYLLFGDGSVNLFTSRSAAAALSANKPAANRLAVP